MIFSAMANLGDGIGAAMPCFGQPPYTGVISGRDARRDGGPYVVQLFSGTSGGPATAHNDGWMVFTNTAGAGLEYVEATEVVEQKYPIVIWEKVVRLDSEGAGRKRGSPGNVAIYGPRFDELECQYFIDGDVNRSYGVRGGHCSQGPEAWLVQRDGRWSKRTETVGEVKVEPGEAIVSLSGAGAGYGAPFERDPQAVLDDVIDGFISVGRARGAYGVVLRGELDRWETLAVDAHATAVLRAQLRCAPPDDDAGRAEQLLENWWLSAPIDRRMVAVAVA
jgi:N-methylhydantoinase B